MNDLADIHWTATVADTGTACIARAGGLIPLPRPAEDRIDAAAELPADVLDASPNVAD